MIGIRLCLYRYARGADLRSSHFHLPCLAASTFGSKVGCRITNPLYFRVIDAESLGRRSKLTNA